MISLKNLILKDQNGNPFELTLDIAPGECVAFVSGSDENTTIMQFLTGEQKPTHGTILIDKIPLEKLSPRLLQLYRQSIGIMLSPTELLGSQSVAENLALPLVAHGVPRKEITQRTTELLQKIALREKSAMRFDLLSEGEKRLVALAIAIVAKPKIVLLPELFAKDCDGETKEMILKILNETQEQGATLIAFTTQPESLEALSPRVISLPEEKKNVLESTQTAWKNTERTRIMPIRL